MNIAQGLIDRARVSPGEPALTHDGKTLTFAALMARVYGLAGALQDRLARTRGDRVAIFLENRPEVLETMFASWVAGLCVVPINAKLHAREVAYIVKDSGAQVVITTQASKGALAEHLPEGSHRLVAVDSAEYAGFVGASSTSPIACAEVAPTDPAWLFYTSGTTGTPKGATLTHRNLLFQAMAYYAGIEQVEPGDTLLHAAPLSHGSGLYSLPHLFGGGQQVILAHFTPADVLAAFQAYPNVSLFAAPTMVTRLVQAAGNVPEPAGNLRTVIYGGGPMYVSDTLKALDVFGNRFIQVFGQGEAPMTITGLGKSEHEGPRDAAHLARLGSCGTPRVGCEVRVVDEHGRDVPTGQPGEIITRSDCVMAGYWNNPKATASALREGWLWTGDIGALDERGYLTLMDRSKDMIISGGTNIYPREIEEVLLQHEGVLECSVVGRKHADWGEEAVAFVVSRAGAPPSTESLDALCLANIARFKRPKHYRFVSSLPKNNYGKVLKTDLRRQLEEETDHA